MRPRVGKKVFALVLASLAIIVGGGTAHAAPPDIILIVTDDQRWDTLSAMPNVRGHLVTRGVNFTNAFVVNPLCCPSRASILTGKYSHSTGVYGNEPPYGGFSAFNDNSTLATWLGSAGYETAFVGKYLNGYSGKYIPPGWTHWVTFTGKPGYTTFDLNDNGTIKAFGASNPAYSTDLLAAEATSIIRSAQRPLFLYFSPYAPHDPATPASRHANAFATLPPFRPLNYNEAAVSDKPAWVRGLPHLSTANRAEIDAFRISQLRSLQAVDEAVEKFLSALADRGALDNALIVFTSDNGYAWGEHRWFTKFVAYEESIRVPLVIRQSSRLPAGRSESRPVLNIDLAATIAEAAAVPAPATDGRSVFPLFSAAPPPWRENVLVEHVSSVGVPSYCALRNTRFAYVQYRTGEEELYNLANDPYQMTNLGVDPRFRSQLPGFRRGVRAACSPPPPDMAMLSPCLILGTDGADQLVGTDWYDLMCAGAGDDSIAAAGGNDRIAAGSGDDFVLAGRGHDTVRGERGRDRLVGGAGKDRLIGGRGRDWLLGGRGVDRLVGGPGNDVLRARDRRRDYVRCGPGRRDRAIVDRRDRVTRCEIVLRRPRR